MSIHKVHSIILWIVALYIFSIQPVAAIETKKSLPEINGHAAVLIDAKTGIILYAKNEKQRMFPASITKMVTAIIALESANQMDIVTISKKARNEEGTRVYLAEGEQQLMGNLIYALLMNSGNDAATAIAEHINGSKEQFSVRMNEFVKEKIGTTDTQFTNPHGLYDPNHYTTAMDMALIAKYAMKNELFRQIVATKTRLWEGKEWKSKLINHNKLLWRYDGVTGIKNGYTSASGFTLVASAKRGDTELIGVVLNSSTSEQIYSDMTVLFDYGFQNYESRLILDKNQTMTHQNDVDQQVFISSEPVWITVGKNEEPVVFVDKEGNLFINSTLSGSAALIATLTPMMEEKKMEKAAEDIPISASETASETASDLASDSIEGSVWRFPITMIWLFMNVYMVLAVHRRRKLKKSN